MKPKEELINISGKQEQDPQPVKPVLPALPEETDVP